MKIIINTESSVPVEIGELKFTLDLSDESIDKYQSQGKEVLEALSKVKNKDVSGLKDGLKSLIDFFLEDGAFEKIYDEYPSVVICSDIAAQLMVNLTEELEARGKSFQNNEKISAYLKKNNK